MWIRVATKSDSLKTGKYGMMYIEGENLKEFFFDEATATLLDCDHFLPEMWNKLDAMFDWGDCDFFAPSKCEKLHSWAAERLISEHLDPKVRGVYATLLEYSQIAVECGTGMYFDF